MIDHGSNDGGADHSSNGGGCGDSWCAKTNVTGINTPTMVHLRGYQCVISECRVQKTG